MDIKQRKIYFKILLLYLLPGIAKVKILQHEETFSQSFYTPNDYFTDEDMLVLHDWLALTSNTL